MINPFISKFLTPTKKFNELSVLLAIHSDSKNSQHKIGEVAHLSGAMVNNYMKDLQQSGLVSVNGDSNRKMSYHLTSTGRDMLVSSFLAYSTEIVQFYAAAKHELGRKLNELHSEGIYNVALFGAAETCEVVLAAIKETPLRVNAIVDSEKSKQGVYFNGIIVQHPERLKQIQPDVVIITSFGRQEEIYSYLVELVGENLKIIKLTDLYEVHNYDSMLSKAQY